MPKVISYTPPWLMRPNPGFDMFAPKPTSGKATNGASAPTTQMRPQKTVATRDTEVFAAVGNEIRWADLGKLKEAYESNFTNLGASRGRRVVAPTSKASFRALKVPVHGAIRQLSISPQGDYMAIATSHTIHIILLPDSSLLDSDDANPIKPKCFQLGPTAHVLEESPVVSILWHPLGYRGRCLITITQDGTIRLWELNRSDRSTFNEPALSVDLKKLANATNDEENLSASKYGASKGFSPDSFELEVASACFGDFLEQEGVHGWAPMTLWVAMVEGDVYALCPFLPSKWQLTESPAASTILETLTTSINANFATVQEEPEATSEDRETAKKQLSWLSDLVYQEPLEEEHPCGEPIKVYTRPRSVPVVPLLQGPFSFTPEFDDQFELTDIIVFSLKSYSDGIDNEPAEGLPAAVVCLLTDTCNVHVCLDFEGIVGRWLPPNTQNQYSLSESPEHNLVLVETIEFRGNAASSPSSNQSITPDIHTDFSFFVTNTSGVFYISMESWIRKLETELSEAQNEGVEFRSKLLFDGANTLVEQSIKKPSQDVTSCVVLEDGNIGYLLLTVVANEPCAVVLDAPEYGVADEEEISRYLATEGPRPELRPPYQPPKELYATSQLSAILDKAVPARHKTSWKEEVRLSPANLELLMTVHKVLSQETHQLGQAVSELFRRCERLRDEFRDQIFRAAQLTTKIDSVTGDDDIPSESSSAEGVIGNAKIEQRFEQVKARQEELSSRYEAIRRKMANVGGRELSEKETGWIEELETMDRSLDSKAQKLTDDQTGTEVPAWQRLENAKGLYAALDKQVKEAMKKGKDEQPRSAVKVPFGSRKQENQQVEELLERNTTLVDAATNRLRNLGISIPLGGQS
ncbi:hypothetical protein K469DRAFT_667284 [Zopfia rhizophila CBS 207.26]|uniref:Uncharacterized protein n=1 Tax=Zopfia rhizophila CBS 207.26 TaxID=1314779 RepID=A0A6A6DWN4_9PEZI|nr:hypothetical protein K469DRAFT_667284 [Zopfia rhizophila CBS 207.26]